MIDEDRRERREDVVEEVEGRKKEEWKKKFSKEWSWYRPQIPR